YVVYFIAWYFVNKFLIYDLDDDFFINILLILVFQWIGSPIASHMVMRLEYETDKEVSKHVRKEKQK
ncbi:MAG: monovalent cation/H(+) antiporter subunit G, partial [Erysipelotrichaceae bacterium]|nr:monovalent cation/H(+) antiporter subunit G [Erysipelotrichaceae bacterium]